MEEFVEQMRQRLQRHLHRCLNYDSNFGINLDRQWDAKLIDEDFSIAIIVHFAKDVGNSGYRRMVRPYLLNRYRLPIAFGERGREQL